MLMNWEFFIVNKDGPPQIKKKGANLLALISYIVMLSKLIIVVWFSFSLILN